MKAFFNWIVHTPSLFHTTPPFEDFTAFDAPIEPKHPFSYQGNQRLGFVYQYLCSQVFESSERFAIREEEIQINQQGQTLGAVDFILEDRQSKQMQHWEVAIKFYLLRQGKWYGPNAHDRLDKKLSRMLSHQLKLTYHPQFIAQKPQYAQLSEHLLIQGRLYINPFEPEPVPDECQGYLLDKSQISGKWCYFHQWPLINKPLYPLEKQQWASGLETFDQPLSQPSGRFIHAQACDGEFWFVVNNSWPNDQ